MDRNTPTMTVQTYPVHDEPLILPPSAVINHEPIEHHDYIEAESFQGNGDETLSIEAKEIELIRKALQRNAGKRKKAADDLGISERTLYRKIKQYELD